MMNVRIAVVGGVLCAVAGCSGTTAPAADAPGSSGVRSDADLFRLVTQSDPFTQYTVFPRVEEFATGRLNGSEAHAPVVRVTLNATAAGALVDGRLPAGRTFPDGAVVFKEVRPSATAAPTLYVIMVKDSTNGAAGQGWLWAEYTPTGATAYSVDRRGGACISCHSREAGPQRDLVRTFERQQ